MFILFGTKQRRTAAGQEMLECHRCGRACVHTIEERQTWFSLFFVPVFPFEKRRLVARCNLCGQETVAR